MQAQAGELERVRADAAVVEKEAEISALNTEGNRISANLVGVSEEIENLNELLKIVKDMMLILKDGKIMIYGLEWH